MSDVPAAQCPLCGEPLLAGATQCTNCGALIPAAANAVKPAPGAPECPECGERVTPGAPECPACGHVFTAKARTPRVPSIEEAHLLEELEWAIAGEVAKPPPPLVPEVLQEVLAEKRRLLAFVAAIPGVSRTAAESVAEFFLDAEQIGMTEGDEVRALPGMTPEEAGRVMDAVRRLLAERRAAAPAAEAAPRPGVVPAARPAVTLLRAPPVAVVRDFAAIGTTAALPVAAVASYANVTGHDWGALFLFGVLLGLAAALSVPSVRAARGESRRAEAFASLAWVVGLLVLTVSAALPLLDPARAPTIVAGVTILIEAVGAFALDGVEVSERDILWGVALDSVPHA